MAKRPRILLVEDDHAVRTMYRTALTLAGCDVAAVPDGLSALYAVENEKPDVIVLDLNLPRLDGRSVMRELHGDQRYAHIPIIIVTGTDVDAAVEQARAILRKPVAPDTLLSIIEAHLDTAA